VPRVAARRPYDHHHPSPQMTGRDIASLAVLEAIVREHGVKALEHLRRIGEVEPPLPQGPLALGLVEGDLHAINVPPINRGVNIYGGTEMERFGAVVEKLVRGCGQQGTEFENWPFDAIAQTVGADEKERTALEGLRENAKKAAERLAADCPQDVPAAPAARLEAVEQGIDAALAAFDTVEPALAAFYGTLDDEQKARLYRDMAAPAAANARETTPRRDAQEERRERREYSSRRDRWRTYAAAREAAAREPTPSQARSQAAAPGWSGAMCEELAAVLRGWPVREIERDVRLSSPQRGPRDSKSAFTRVCDALCVAGCPSRRVLRARHRFAQGRRHARGRLPGRARAHPGRPHGRDAQAPCRRACRHRRDPPRAHAFLRGTRPGAEGEIRGDELGGGPGRQTTNPLRPGA